MTPTRRERALGWPLTAKRITVAGATLAVVAVVLAQVLSGGRQAAEGAPAGAVVSRSATPAAPFSGWLLVYGRHALTPGQVQAANRVVHGRAVAVYGQEVPVRSARSDFPIVAVQALAVDPSRYAEAAGDRSLRPALVRGVVLSRRGAALRGARQGMNLLLANGQRRPITAVVSDALLGGAEMATAARTVNGVSSSLRATYLLVPQGESVPDTVAAIRSALPDIDLRIESRTRNGLLSSADTVLTQAQMKQVMGEFAMRQDADGSLSIDERWERVWIRRATLPQLGRIACNKAVIEDLRSAMQEVTRRGLGKLIDTSDFRRQGGCWNPRVVRFGGSQISAHTWGAAVDINVAANPLGSPPVQDPRLVDIMRRHGFSWGGLWLRPDGAHFQWTGSLAGK